MEHTAVVFMLNGAIVFFAGMLAGFPYGLVLVAKNDSQAESNWRIAHSQNLQNGMLLLLVGACLPYLTLSQLSTELLLWSLVAAAYLDMTAWFIRATTGHSGLVPEPPLLNLVVVSLFGLTVIGQIVGIGIFIFGAWSAWGGFGAN